MLPPLTYHLTNLRQINILPAGTDPDHPDVHPTPHVAPPAPVRISAPPIPEPHVSEVAPKPAPAPHKHDVHIPESGAKYEKEHAKASASPSETVSTSAKSEIKPGKVTSDAEAVAASTKELAGDVGKKSKVVAEDVEKKGEQVAKDVGKKTEQVAKDVSQKSKQLSQDIGEKSEQVARDVGEKSEQIVNDVEETSKKVAKKAKVGPSDDLCLYLGRVERGRAKTWSLLGEDQGCCPSTRSIGRFDGCRWVSSLVLANS
jgi:hypothetical protein